MAGIFLTPVVIDPGTADPFNLVKITVLWTFVLVGGGLWVSEKVRLREGVRPSLLGSLGLVVLAVTVAATALSQNPALSTIGIYKRYGGLASTALYVLILWMVIDLYRDRRERLREVVLAVAWAGVLVAAYVLVQQFAIDPIEWVRNPGASLVNPISTLGNSQFAGDYLGISVPAFVYVLLTSPRAGPRARGRLAARLRSRRGVVGAGLVLVGTALWLTSSRSGMVAAIVGMAGLMVVERERVPRWAKLGAGGLVLVGALVGVAVLWHPGMEQPPSALQRVEVLRAESVGFRAYWWEAGARMVADNPILGTGPETYGVNLPEYRSVGEGAELGLWVADKPHNVFVERAVGTGLLGLGAYLVLVGAALWAAWRRGPSLDPPERLLLATFVGLLLAYLAQGLFSIDVPPLAIVGWVALGGIGAVADPGIRQEEDDPTAGRRTAFSSFGRGTRIVAYVMVALLVAGLVVVGIRPLRADQQVKEARRVGAADEPPGEAIDHFARAFSLHPYEPVHRSMLAGYLEELGREAEEREEKARLFERAVGFYERALELQPGNIYYMLPIARLHMAIARLGRPEHWEASDRWWRRIVEHDPNDWEAHAQYGRMLLARAGDVERVEPVCRAVEQFRRANEINRSTLSQAVPPADAAEQIRQANEEVGPKKVRVWVRLADAYLSLRRFDDARAALERALQVAPQDEQAQNLLGSLEGMSGGDPVPCPDGG